jgi:hypothetical protein
MQGIVNINHGMRVGDKGGFELGRSKINSPLEHPQEKPAVAIGIAPFGLRIVADVLVREKETGQRADIVDNGFNAISVDDPS